jgi:hypothetical protein
MIFEVGELSKITLFRFRLLFSCCGAIGCAANNPRCAFVNVSKYLPRNPVKVFMAGEAVSELP